jgi:hypothetical protein
VPHEGATTVRTDTHDLVHLPGSTRIATSQMRSTLTPGRSLPCPASGVFLDSTEIPQSLNTPSNQPVKRLGLMLRCTMTRLPAPS